MIERFSNAKRRKLIYHLCWLMNKIKRYKVLMHDWKLKNKINANNRIIQHQLCTNFVIRIWCRHFKSFDWRFNLRFKRYWSLISFFIFIHLIHRISFRLVFVFMFLCLVRQLQNSFIVWMHSFFVCDDSRRDNRVNFHLEFVVFLAFVVHLIFFDIHDFIWIYLISTKFIFDFAFFLFSFVNFRRIHFLIFSSTFIQFIFSLFSRLIRNRRFCFHFAKKFVHLKNALLTRNNRVCFLFDLISIVLFIFRRQWMSICFCFVIAFLQWFHCFHFFSKFLKNVRCWLCIIVISICRNFSLVIFARSTWNSIFFLFSIVLICLLLILICFLLMLIFFLMTMLMCLRLIVLNFFVLIMMMCLRLMILIFFVLMKMMMCLCLRSILRILLLLLMMFVCSRLMMSMRLCLMTICLCSIVLMMCQMNLMMLMSSFDHVNNFSRSWFFFVINKSFWIWRFVWAFSIDLINFWIAKISFHSSISSFQSFFRIHSILFCFFFRTSKHFSCLCFRVVFALLTNQSIFNSNRKFVHLSIDVKSNETRSSNVRSCCFNRNNSNSKSMIRRLCRFRFFAQCLFEIFLFDVVRKKQQNRRQKERDFWRQMN